MSWVTPSQLNAEAARDIYRMVGNLADKMVAAGKIAADHRDAWWNTEVAKRLQAMKIYVPREMAAKAGLEVVTPGAAQVTEQAAAAAARATAQQTAAGAAKSALRTAAPITAVLFAVESAWTGIKYLKGDIDGAEAGKRIGESAAGNGGALVFAAGGAAIGSIVPVVGTAIGGFAGGIVGNVVSRWGARRLLRRAA
ncbi:hypothetical protein [Paraburkholderia youngii]|uniref:hypothetical protein n=1 Tax=Paraburkholderia youngii TaxID=2782701 RepID=UPI003D1BE6DA